MMEQYYNNEQCPIQPVNRICNRHHPLHPLQSNTESYLERREKVKVPSTQSLFLLTGLCFPKFGNL